MTVGIVGLGLIGGSFAKAYSAAGHKVAAFDVDRPMLEFAMLDGAVECELKDDMLADCDLILICTYPQAAADYMRDHGAMFGKKPIVMDCCGTKRDIVEAGMKYAEEYGFTYVGGHPMAGTQFSGFKYARKDLYVGAPMVIVPPVYDDMMLLGHIKDLLEPAGFREITVTTAEKHDEMIAFTSQLAHVVSSAYIKSPTALEHNGFSAGSYRDMTRVAWLNPVMWSELFLDNRENLLKEINVLIDNLVDYRNAIENKDEETLRALLEEGKRRKEEVDG